MKKFLGIRADWRALSLCVLAACSFWLLKALNNDYTDNIYYPIKIEYNEKKVVPLNKPPKYIRLNVSGYGWNLLRNYVGIKVDPIQYKPTNLPRRKYALASELLPLIKKQVPDINLNYIITDTLYFEFDRFYTKKVKVILDSAELSLSPSYKFTSPIVITPDTVLLQGPYSLLKDQADTIHVRLPDHGISEDYNQKIKIPDQGFDYRIDLLNKEVRVRFGVAGFEKGSLSVAARLVNFPDDEKLTTDRKVIITYYVNEENKNKVDRSSFDVYLDYKKMDKHDHTIKPTLARKPSFVKDYYFTPYAVKVKKK